MGPLIQPGTPLALVVTTATGVVSVPSVVLSEDEQGVRVLSEDTSLPDNALVVAVARDRWYVRGAIVNHGGGVVTLALCSDWERPADQRVEPRYPTHVPARILGPSFPKGHDATIVDASFAGLAIEVGEPWIETRFLLSVNWQRQHCSFRCLLEASETTRNGIVLHSQLVDLDGPQRQLLADIIATSKTSFEEAQRYLATRANDPERYRAVTNPPRGPSTPHGQRGEPRA